MSNQIILDVDPSAAKYIESIFTNINSIAKSGGVEKLREFSKDILEMAGVMEPVKMFGDMLQAQITKEGADVMKSMMELLTSEPVKAGIEMFANFIGLLFDLLKPLIDALDWLIGTARDAGEAIGEALSGGSGASNVNRGGELQ